jgi:fibronectin-binding autotransporter adhesin
MRKFLSDILVKASLGVEQNAYVLGTVGIGTASPNNTLEVKGADSSTVQAIFQSKVSTNDGYNGGIQLGNALASQNSQIYHSSAGDNTLTFISNYSSGTANKFVFAPGGTERVRFLQNGNVGIGTTSPANKLDVVGDGIRTSADQSTSAFLVLSGTSTEGRITVSSYGSYQPMTFYTGGSERMRINTSGNVGIGTTSPGQILTLSSTSTSGTALNIINTSSGGYNWNIFSEGSDASKGPVGSLIFRDSTNGVTRMLINTSGNVGIGTTSPDARLSVKSIETSAKAITILGRSDDIGTIRFFNSAGTSEQGGIISTATSFGLMYNDVTRLYIAAATGNVGIGTTSPSKKLHIKGGDDDVLFLDNGGQQYTTQYFANNGTTKAFLAWDNTNSVYSIGTAVSAAFYFSTNNTERMRITPGGNVGIGTTSPGYKLDVVSSDSLIARFNGSAVAASSATEIDVLGPQSNGELNLGVGGSTLSNSTNNIQNKGFITAGSGLDGLNLRSDQGYVQITAGGITSANEVARFTAAGNVGIGTTSPGAMLDIYHATNGYASVGLQGYSTAAKWFLTSGISGDTIQDFSISHNNNGTSPVFRLSNSTGAATFSSSVTASSFGGNSYPYNSILGSGADASTGTIFAGSTSGYASSIDVAGGGAANPNTIIFKTASTEKMRITTGGNVGIGTSTGHYFTTNRTVLNINGTSSSILGLQAGNTTAGYLYSDANDFTISTEGTRNLNLVTAGNAPMVFQTNTTEKMRITSAGNVGIGTTSPTQLLHLVGTNAANNGLTLQNTNASGNSQVRFLNTSGTERAAITYVNGSDAVYHYTAAGGNLLNLVGGNVGIGTTTPGTSFSELLQVSKSDVGRISATHTNTTGSRQSDILFTEGATLQFQVGTILGNGGYADQNWIRGVANIPLTFYTNDTERMRILSGGNVLIGTTTDAGVKLDVSNGSNNVYIRAITSGSANWATLLLQNGDGSWHVTNDDTGTFNIGTTNDPSTEQKLSITSTGNVGIGTGSPVTNAAYNRVLHINSPSGVGTVLKLTDTTTGTAAADGFELLQYGVDSYLLNRENGRMFFYTDNNQRMVIDSSGNVGIGTTSPSTKLHVDYTSGTGLTLSNTQANLYAEMRLQSASGSAFIFKSSNGYSAYGGVNALNVFNEGQIAFHSSSVSNIMYLAANGNVGIGTTSPAFKLDVSGTGRVDASFFASGFFTTSPITGLTTITGNAGGSTFNQSQGLAIGWNYTAGGGEVAFSSNKGAGSVGGFKFYDWNGTTATQLLSILPSGAATFSSSVTATQGFFTATANTYAGGALRLTAHTGGTQIFLTSVGTSFALSNGGSVDHLLIASTGAATFSSSVTTGGDLRVPTGSKILYESGAGTGNSIYRDPANGNSIFTSAVDFKFANNNASTTYLTLTSSTGAATFSSSVTAGGAISTSGTGLNASVRISNTTSSTGKDWHLYSLNNGNLGLYNNTDGLYAYQITPGGNVGIGTTSPLQTSANRVVTTINGITSAILNLGVGGNLASYYYADASGSTLETVGTNTISASGANIIQLTTNGSERMRITSGGNVGIGTTSPADTLSYGKALDIQSSTGAAIYLRDSDATSVYGLFAYDGGGINRTNIGGIGANNYVRIISAGNEAIRIDASGNVGIGTTNPSNGKLQVNGRIYTVGTAGTANAIFQGGQLEFYKDATPTYAASIGLSGPSSGGTNDIVFETYGGTWSERMRIATGGNVGIGTTTPGEALVVNRSGGANSIMCAFTDTGQSGIKLLAGTGSTNRATRIDFLNGVSSGTTPRWTLLNDYSQNGTNDFRFVNSDTSTSVLTLLQNGNVGIGTTSPSGKLSIVTSGTNDLLYLNSGVNTDFAYKIVSGLDDAFVLRRQHTTQGDLSIMSWTYSGKVGIGTTNPTGKLTISQNNSGGVAALTFTEDESTIQGPSANTKILMGGNLSLNAASTWIAGTNGSERMRITSAGDVGIGTSTPAGVLNVNGSSGADFLLSRTSGATSGVLGTIRFGNQNIDSNMSAISAEQDGANNAANLIFSTQATGAATTERMRITSGGNVGIGTTSPSSKFHVKGNATDDIGLTVIENDYASGGIYYPGLSVINTRGNHSYGVVAEFRTNTAGDSDRPSILFYGEQAAHSWQIGQTTIDAGWGASDDFAIGYRASNDPTTFNNFPTAYLTVKTGGNVGIGTTGPSYKLHVEGNTSGISIYASHDIAAFSDITVKKEVKRIENAIEKVKELNGYTYVRTDDETGTRRAGVIAQEVQKVLPEVVSANPDGTLNVAYSNMVALLIEAIKEQQNEIDELKKLLKK